MTQWKKRKKMETAGARQAGRLKEMLAFIYLQYTPDKVCMEQYEESPKERSFVCFYLLSVSAYISHLLQNKDGLLRYFYNSK